MINHSQCLITQKPQPCAVLSRQSFPDPWPPESPELSPPGKPEAMSSLSEKPVGPSCESAQANATRNSRSLLAQIPLFLTFHPFIRDSTVFKEVDAKNQWIPGSLRTTLFR